MADSKFIDDALSLRRTDGKLECNASDEVPGLQQRSPWSLQWAQRRSILAAETRTIKTAERRIEMERAVGLMPARRASICHRGWSWPPTRRLRGGDQCLSEWRHCVWLPHTPSLTAESNWDPKTTHMQLLLQWQSSSSLHGWSSGYTQSQAKRRLGPKIYTSAVNRPHTQLVSLNGARPSSTEWRTSHPPLSIESLDGWSRPSNTEVTVINCHHVRRPTDELVPCDVNHWSLVSDTSWCDVIDQI